MRLSASRAVPGAALAALVLLAGCGGRDRAQDAPATGGGVAAPIAAPQPSAEALASCEGAPYLHLIGQDATALERELILRQVRILRPNRPVTMDYRAERLNFTINELNRIARISCG